MKGAFAAFLTLVIAGAMLYLHSADVASDGRGRSEFKVLHKAALAAREHKPLYARDAGVKNPEDFTLTRIAEEEETRRKAAEAAGEESSTESVIPQGPIFAYPPYFSLILLPFSFIKSFETAALSWYWLNAVLFVLALLFVSYTLGGKLGGGGKALILVPVIVAAPLMAWYLPTQTTLILAMFLVIGGLALYRAGQDVLAGVLSSLALFSPLGAIFFAYYILKRAWIAVLGLSIGAIVWFALIPAVYFGYQGALDETQNYVSEVLAPLPGKMLSDDSLMAGDNHSLWATAKRNEQTIRTFVEEAVESAKEENVEIGNVNWPFTLLLSVGIFIGFATLVSLWRKHGDRSLTIVGLEGGLAIAAYLLLSPVTTASMMILAIVPLVGCAYAVRLGDVKRFSYHTTYVGLVLAAEFIYVAYMWNATIALGSIFATLFVLWVAVLAGVSQFRPQLVRGRRTVLDEGPKAPTGKPIDLVPVKARGDEKDEKKEKEAKSKLGGIIPMPSFTWKKGKLEGAAGISTDLPKPDSTPVDLIPDDGKEGDGKSKKIKLE